MRAVVCKSDVGCLASGKKLSRRTRTISTSTTCPSWKTYCRARRPRGQPPPHRRRRRSATTVHAIRHELLHFWDERGKVCLAAHLPAPTNAALRKRGSSDSTIPYRWKSLCRQWPDQQAMDTKTRVLLNLKHNTSRKRAERHGLEVSASAVVPFALAGRV